MLETEKALMEKALNSMNGNKSNMKMTYWTQACFALLEAVSILHCHLAAGLSALRSEQCTEFLQILQ